MLPYALAIVIALFSLILFGAAFFSRDVHRKDDFLWSGVGLFYALVLWLCAEGLSGAVLLGQTAAALLVISFGWQTLKLRKAIAYPDRIAELESFSVLDWVMSRLSSLFSRKAPLAPKKSSEPPKPSASTPEDLATEPTPLESPNLSADTEEKQPEPSLSTEEDPFHLIHDLEMLDVEEDMGEETEIAPRPILPQESVSPPPPPPPPEKPAKKGFSLPKFLGLGKRKATPKPETITQAIDQVESSKDNDEWDLGESSAGDPPASSETVSVTEAEVIKTEAEPPLRDETLSVAEVEEVKTEADVSLTVETVPQEREETIQVTSPLETLSFSTDDLEFEEFINDDQAETILESSPIQLKKSQPPVNPIDSESIPTITVENEEATPPEKTAPVTGEAEEKIDSPKASNSPD